uniref:EAL domain-containing response regulator n=1 Tax=Thaumasiovibrio occultus TaxID=1891184 RepID=UPI000B362A45|nr:EAL domain-containing response regulator [Thaumasiovibrio occultus]
MMAKKQWIVVIDDSKSFLSVVKAQLNHLGYEHVFATTSPRMALDAISRTPDRFTAVLTDLDMPSIDGMEVVRQLGQMGFRGGFGIISGVNPRIAGLACEIARLYNLPNLGYLGKPVHLPELRHLMNRMQLTAMDALNTAKPLSKDEFLDVVSHNAITPYYQPKIDLRTHSVVGVEVLARIVHPTSTTVIEPGRFISVATRHGMLDLLTMQLIEKAVTDYAALRALFGNAVKIGLNISPSQLEDLSFPEWLRVMLQDNTISSEAIVLEVTEDYSLKTRNQLETLNRLGLKGYHLSLDDYGSGYTNLQQLRQLPFNEIKIDRSLINEIEKDHFSQLVVKSLVELTGEIDAVLVAEGVERQEELNYLKRLSESILVQGFLMCPPKSLPELAQWYQGWQATMASA